MKDLKVTGFVGTPGFLVTVIARAEELGYDFNRDFTLKKAWFTGEMLSPSVRQKLEGEYHLKTSQSYSVSECGGAIAIECDNHDGLHLLDDYIIEIVDPETGVPLGPEEPGEIVVTPLHNPTWGLLRFGTGDISAYTEKPCACGNTSRRLLGIMGRTGEAVKVRGMFVVAGQAQKVICAEGAVARCQLVVRRRRERDTLLLRYEAGTGSTEAEISKRFTAQCRVKIDSFELLAPGTLEKDAPLIVDERQWR